jgi:hypothetical protein
VAQINVHPLLKPLFENKEAFPFLENWEVPYEFRGQPIHLVLDALDEKDPQMLPRWFPRKGPNGKKFSQSQRQRLFEIYLEDELPDDYNQQESRSKAKSIAQSLLLMYSAIQGGQIPDIIELS